MKLNLEPGEIPFKVGDHVFISHPYGTMNHDATLDSHKNYFEAEIIRIFIEFSNSMSIIKERKNTHHFAINVITYDLKPIDFYQDQDRVTLRVDLRSDEKFVFDTEKNLLLAQVQVIPAPLNKDKE
jgi:hypothetical protein